MKGKFNNRTIFDTVQGTKVNLKVMKNLATGDKSEPIGAHLDKPSRDKSELFFILYAKRGCQNKAWITRGFYLLLPFNICLKRSKSTRPPKVAVTYHREKASVRSLKEC